VCLRAAGLPCGTVLSISHSSTAKKVRRLSSTVALSFYNHDDNDDVDDVDDDRQRLEAM